MKSYKKSEGNFSHGHMYSGCVVHLESDDSALHRYVPNVTLWCPNRHEIVASFRNVTYNIINVIIQHQRLNEQHDHKLLAQLSCSSI